jgi:hypothetical protein
MTSLRDPSNALAKIERVLEHHRIDLSTKVLLESAAQDLSGEDRELENVRSAIWAFFELRDGGRAAQAEGMLRSALPDDYRPVGA